MDISRKLAVVLIALISAPAAHADLITYDFEGQFDRSADAGADVELLDPFTASFSYDDDAPLFSIVEAGTRARYNTGSIWLNSGAFSYQATSGPQLQIFDGWGPSSGRSPRDSFFLSVEQGDLVGSGYYLLQVDMLDSTALTIDSLAIPSTSTVELMAGNGRLFLRRFSTRNVEEWSASGRFSEVHSVPEPGTLALFGVGLLSMSLARRRKAA